MTFDGDDTEYVVVGTAYVLPEEPEPSRGRLMVFEIKDNRLVLVTEKDLKGVCPRVPWLVFGNAPPPPPPPRVCFVCSRGRLHYTWVSHRSLHACP